MDQQAAEVPNFFERKSVIILACSILFVVLAIVFQKKFTEFTSLGLIGIFLINLFGSATLFLPAPAMASVVAGGVLYAPVFVALFSSLGSSLGELVGFFIGQSSKKVVAKKKQSKLYIILYNIFQKYGNAALFVFAIIPNPFFDFFGIMAGMFGVRLWRFFIIIFIARFIRDVMLASFGSIIPLR